MTARMCRRILPLTRAKVAFAFKYKPLTHNHHQYRPTKQARLTHEFCLVWCENLDLQLPVCLRTHVGLETAVGAHLSCNLLVAGYITGVLST